MMEISSVIPHGPRCVRWRRRAFLACALAAGCGGSADSLLRDAPLPDAPLPDAALPDAALPDASPTATYTVAYDGNGNTSGSVPVDTHRYTEGQTATALEPGDLSRTGFAFAGWTTNPDVVGASASHAAGATWTMGAADVTLYAVWIPAGLVFTSSGSVIAIQNRISCPAGLFSIPPGVTAIVDNGLASCSTLSGVSIPSSVTSIDSGTFYGCLGLMAITVDASNPSYSSLDGALLDKDQHTLVAAPCGVTSYTVPSMVTSIGASAFGGCENLSSVTIPSSVETIGDGAFIFSTRLESVTIPSSVTSLGRLAFAYGGLKSVSIPASVTTIGQIPFNGCAALTSIMVDPSSSSFSSSAGVLLDKAQTTLLEAPGAITSYTIPASVTTIGADAFDDCFALTTITIPATVTSIASRAFYCAGLTSVTMQAATPPSLGPAAFDNCPSLPTYPIHVPSSAAVVAYDAAPVWSDYSSRIVTP